MDNVEDSKLYSAFSHAFFIKSPVDTRHSELYIRKTGYFNFKFFLKKIFDRIPDYSVERFHSGLQKFVPYNIA